MADKIPRQPHFWIVYTGTPILAGEQCRWIHSSILPPVRVENEELAMAP
ncbi:MAG: hypothetical protein ACXWPP_03040 [Ktedonobacteraceae bacterium]